MRILYHHRTGAEDGQAVHIRALIAALREEGQEVREVSLVERSGAARRSALPSLAGRAPRIVREAAEYGYSAWAAARLVATGRSFSPDFLYERYAFGNVGGVFAARALRTPLFLEVNSPLALELGTTRGLAAPRVAFEVERFVLRSADRIAPVTEVLGEMLIELGAPRERVVVIPNGVFLDRFAYADRIATRNSARVSLGVPAEIGGRPPLVLGFTGFYRDWHRLDLAIEALGSPELAHAVLVVIGAGLTHDALVDQASALRVSDRVRFIGPRPHHEIPGLLPAFDVALIPAINRYASPLKLQEYLAGSLAVIAPDQPNIREVLTHGQNGLLFSPGDRRALHEAIVRLGRDPELRAQLGTAGRRTIVQRELTWRGNARRVLAAMSGRDAFRATDLAGARSAFDQLSG